MGRAVVAGVLGLVVGIAAGVAIGLAIAGGEAAEHVVARREGTGVSAAADAPRKGPAPRPRAGEPSVGPDAAPSAGAATGLEVAGEAPVRPAPTGSGVIRAVVRTADGRPVPDIPFQLMAEYRPAPGSPAQKGTAGDPFATRPLEERMRAHLERERWADATRQVRKSDADGRVAFDGLGDGFHQVYPVAAGWQIVAGDFQLSRRCRAGTELTFTATQFAGIRARVTLPDGQAPGSAMLWFSAGENAGQHGSGWSSATETVWNQPGRFRVWAVAGATQEWRSDPVTVDLAVGEVAEVDLPLRSLPGFGGTVRMTPGDWPGLTWAQMYAVRASGADVPSLDQFQSEGTQTTTGPHDGWRYSFTGLSPGRYAVAFVPAGSQEAIAMWTLDVGESFVSRDFDLGPPDRSRFVEVIVLDPEGSPCKPPVQFVLESRSPTSSRSGGTLTIPRPDGTYWLLLPAAAAAPDAIHSVIASQGEFGTKAAEFKPGPNAAVEVRYEWPAFVDVTVDGWEAHPDRGAFSFELRPVAAVRMRSSHHMSYSARNGVPDVSGRLRLGPLAPGEYEVSVRVKTRHSVRGVGDTPVSLPAGSTPVRISLPPLHSLAIDGGPARAGRNFSVRAGAKGRSGDHVGSYTADADGAVTVTRLVAGEYTIQVDGEREQKSVTVPDTSSLKF